MIRAWVLRKMEDNHVTSKNTLLQILSFVLPYPSPKDPCFHFPETGPPRTQIFPPWKIPERIINCLLSEPLEKIM